MDDLANRLRGRPPVAELLVFICVLSSNPLPIDKARATALARAVRRRELLVSPSFTAEVGEYELRNGVPKLEACLVIEPSVLSRVDPAQAGLRRHVVVAGKGPNDAW